MTQKEAYDITRPFYCYVGGFIHTLSAQKPIKEKVFYFIIYKRYVSISYKNEKDQFVPIKNIKRSKYNKYFKNSTSFYEVYTYFDGDFYQESNVDKLNKSNGEVVFTSKGFVSVLEFFDAEHIMNNREKIKRVDLIVGEKYLSITGDEYFYLGDENGKYKCLNSKNKQILLSSIKLIDLI